MIKTIIECDVCNARANSYRILIGKSMDASGNGYQNDYINKDLCDECLEEFADKFPDQKVYEFSK